MFSLSSLFISSAWAQNAAAVAAPAQQPSMLQMIEPYALPVGLIIMLYYFMLVRPQQATYDKHAAMIKGLQRGDKVATAAGILGTVTKLDDDVVTLEISDGVTVKVVRSTLTDTVKPKTAVAEKKN